MTKGLWNDEMLGLYLLHSSGPACKFWYTTPVPVFSVEIEGDLSTYNRRRVLWSGNQYDHSQDTHRDRSCHVTSNNVIACGQLMYPYHAALHGVREHRNTTRFRRPQDCCRDKTNDCRIVSDIHHIIRALVCFTMPRMPLCLSACPSDKYSFTTGQA